MTAALEVAAAAAHDRQGQVDVRVGVTVRQTRAIEQQGVVQQRTVAVRRRPELVQEVAEEFRLVGIELGIPVHLLGSVTMVRQRVMGIVDANLRIRAAAHLPAIHEREDAGDVGLVGQPLQVEHKLDVVAEDLRNGSRWLVKQAATESADGSLPVRRRRLSLLDATLDFAHRIKVFGRPGAIARPEARLQSLHVLRDRIENATVLSHLRATTLGGAAFAKQPLEHDAWVILGRQRGCRRPPRNRIEVCAAVAVLTIADQIVDVDREFEGRKRSLAAELGGCQLVDRGAGPDIGPLRELRMHPVQPRRRASSVVAIACSERFRLRVAQPADNHHLVAIRLERGEDWGQGHVGAGTLRPPKIGARMVHCHAVRQVQESETLHRPGG